MKSSISNIIKVEDNKGQDHTDYNGPAKRINNREQQSNVNFAWGGNNNCRDDDTSSNYGGKKKTTTHPAAQNNGNII